jgi:antitoxin component YwqK of YwqJK toxin-antitoxin module
MSYQLALYWLLFSFPVISQTVYDYEPVSDSIKSLLAKDPCLYNFCDEMAFCQDPKDGDYECTGEAGRTVIKGTVKNGKFQGKYIWYYGNGNRRMNAFMLNGLLEGIGENYYPNGKVESIIEYKAGKVWNVKEMRDASGRILNPGTLKDGTGELIYYRADGSKMKKFLMFNGVANGRCEYYYLNNKVMIEGHFFNNKLSGKWKEYDGMGKLLKTTEFISNVRKRSY